MICARIVQHDPLEFMVIVSTSGSDHTATDDSGTLRCGSSPTLAGANALREELIPIVRTAAHLRGHSVTKVERMGPS
jgi:hypothetical protein